MQCLSSQVHMLESVQECRLEPCSQEFIHQIRETPSKHWTHMKAY